MRRAPIMIQAKWLSKVKSCSHIENRDLPEIVMFVRQLMSQSKEPKKRRRLCQPDKGVN